VGIAGGGELLRVVPETFRDDADGVAFESQTDVLRFAASDAEDAGELLFDVELAALQRAAGALGRLHPV